jgi:hypothetical protein
MKTLDDELLEWAEEHGEHIKQYPNCDIKRWIKHAMLRAITEVASRYPELPKASQIIPKMWDEVFNADKQTNP